MRFADWTLVWATGAAVVVLVVAFALDFTRRRHLLDKIGHAPQLARMIASYSPGRRVLKAALTVLGVALVALSLARPQMEGESQWRQRGIDVALVMDFSKSMLAADAYPSRIDHAKLDAERILAELGGDRAAIVAFAGASVHYPLTTDYEAARSLFRGLTPQDLAGGSDIGDAVREARCLLRPDLHDDPDCGAGRGHGGDPLDERESAEGKKREIETTELGDRAKAMVILTDGEDTEGRARAEVDKAAQLGIQVYLVGIGTRTGGQIPELDEEGRQAGWKVGPDGKSYVTTKLDEPALLELAKAAGGADHYFRDQPRRIDVTSELKALRRLKEGDLDQRVVKRWGEAYQWLLFPGFMVLLIEACLSERRRGRGAKAVRA